MLLIARRTGEAIQIGPDIEVKILKSSASRVTVAVSAPKGLKIRRLDKDSRPTDDVTDIDTHPDR